MKIKCFITGKMRNDTPEERIRQFYAKKLHEEYGYPKELMDIEYPIQRGSKKTGEAADIVIFHSKEKTQKNIFIVVETKSLSVKHPDNQALSYTTATTAVWAMWTNGDNFVYYLNFAPNLFFETTLV